MQVQALPMAPMCLGSVKVSTVAFQAANVEFKSHPKCQKPGSARMI